MKPTSRRAILVLSYLTYLCLGAFTAAVGPVLGELATQTSSSLAAIGGVLTALFVGALIAQLAGGPITDRAGYKPVLIGSLFLLALGISGFTNMRTLSSMIALVLFAGLGQGGLDMTANLVVADAAPHNTTSALNVLHFFFGLGAFIGPALAGLAMAFTGSGFPAHWTFSALFLILALAALRLLGSSRARAVDDSPAVPSAVHDWAFYRSTLLWLMSALMLVYVGIEFGLGSWITSYMDVSTGMLPHFGAIVTSSFWAALSIGRLAGAATSSRLTRLQLLATSLAGSFLGGLGLVLGHEKLLPTILSLAWIGFMYGPVYPTTVALAAAAFPEHKGKAISLLVAMGSIGAATLPFVAGTFLESGTPLGYVGFTTLGLGLLLVILLAIARGLRSQDLRGRI